MPTGESKFFDTDIAELTTAAAGALFPTTNNSLVLMQQGNGDSNRIGRKVTVTSVHIHGRVRIVAAADLDLNAVVRIILFEDKQCNGANATVAGILDTGAAQDFLAFRNLDQTGRFRVLKEIIKPINASGGSGNGTTDKSVGTCDYFSMNVKCNIPILYSASTGAVSDLASSNIALLVIADTTDAKVVMQARVRYTDM